LCPARQAQGSHKWSTVFDGERKEEVRGGEKTDGRTKAAKRKAGRKERERGKKKGKTNEGKGLEGRGISAVDCSHSPRWRSTHHQLRTQSYLTEFFLWRGRGDTGTHVTVHDSNSSSG
jgi:hypothetical protein